VDAGQIRLRVPLPDVVAMQTLQPNLEGAGEIRLRRLVKDALRLRPSRIVVGEVRQEECLDLLIALNSAFPGCAACMPQCSRGRGEDVHPAAAGGGEE
jgi:Flp pilus assembly CpaF family ATPase